MSVNSDFYKFCRAGAVNEVIKAIGSGADVNARDENGNTALIFAASNRPRTKIISALLEHGADANVRNRDGVTALMFVAAKTMRPDVITMMLNAGASADTALSNGWTALMFAAAENPDPEVINALRCGNTAVNHSAADGTTALMLAAERNPNADVVRELIRHGAYVNAKDGGGRTALIGAALRNSKLVSEPDPNPEIIDALLDGGADVNIVWDGDRAIDIVKDSPYLRGTDTMTRLKALSAHEISDDTLTQEQVQKMFDSIDRSDAAGLRDYALLSLILSCGLSCTEISMARVGDIERINGGTFLNIDGDKVNIPDHVMTAIQEYWDTRGEITPDAPLFNGEWAHRRQHMSARAISAALKSIAKKTGGDTAAVTPNSLRHTAVRMALLSGRRLEDVKQFARHRYIGTTYRYSDMSVKRGQTCGETIASALF